MFKSEYFSQDHYLTQVLRDTSGPSTDPASVCQSFIRKQKNRDKIGNIGKKEHVKLMKYQRLREELEKMWRVKATVVLRGNQSTCCSDPQTGRFTE